MPKRFFWPATLVTMGLIFLASNMGYLPAQFWSLWPIILIVAGLGGLLTADREDWIVLSSRRSSSASRPASRAKKPKKKSR